MVSRSKAMYSATLEAKELEPLLATALKKSVRESIQAVLKWLQQDSYDQPQLNPLLIQAVQRLFERLSDQLLQQPKHPDRKVLLKGLFHLLDFRRIVQLSNDAMHVIHSQANATLQLVCLNASNHLTTIIEQLKGTIFFSATLEPLSYYQAYLTKDVGKVLHVESPSSRVPLTQGKSKPY